MLRVKKSLVYRDGWTTSSFSFIFWLFRNKTKRNQFYKTKQSIKWNIPGSGVVVRVPTIVAMLFQTGKPMLVGACGAPSLNKQTIKLVRSNIHLPDRLNIWTFEHFEQFENFEHLIILNILNIWTFWTFWKFRIFRIFEHFEHAFTWQVLPEAVLLAHPIKSSPLGSLSVS